MKTFVRMLKGLGLPAGVRGQQENPMALNIMEIAEYKDADGKPLRYQLAEGNVVYDIADVHSRNASGCPVLELTPEAI